MQTLQAGKALQDMMRYGFVATNLTPQPGCRRGYSVVGGLLIDECDGLGALLIRRQP